MSLPSNAPPKAFSVSIVHDDAHAAGEEAADELIDGLGAAPDLVIVFFSADFDAEKVSAGLRARLPSSTEIVGCSSYAEVSQEEALTHSVSALGLRLPGVQWQTFARAPDERSSHALGQSIGEEIRDTSPQVVFLFPDVLRQNATQLLRGVLSVLGENVPVIGGAAGDSGSFTKTFQIRNAEVISGGVCGVALHGDLRVVTAAHSGYTPVGLPRTATKVEGGNVLLTLDGKPALQVYREFLGARALEMPAVSIEFPLGVVSEGGMNDNTVPSLVRAIFRVDEERQALVLGGDIPEGSKIRILRAARDAVIEGATIATENACSGMPRADVAFLFNCMSRKVVLGPRYKEECAASFRLLPPDLPRIGFYTFGELSPLGGISVHHESTFTIALLQFSHAM